MDPGTLTILALPEYNGTVVECVAFFIDGSPPTFTPPVILIIQGRVVHVHTITGNEFHHLVKGKSEY